MAKYEVVANIQVIFTIDDTRRSVDHVMVCDSIPMFADWHDVWRLGDNYPMSDEVVQLPANERSPIQRIAEEVEWPPVLDWEMG